MGKVGVAWGSNYYHLFLHHGCACKDKTTKESLLEENLVRAGGGGGRGGEEGRLRGSG